MSRVEVADEEQYPNQWALQERATKNCIKGRRGQAFLKELEQALLDLPVKRLIKNDFCREGEVCTIGSVAVHREMRAGLSREEALKKVEAQYKAFTDGDDEEDSDNRFAFTADTIGFGKWTLAWQIMFQNDERNDDCTPEERYARILKWVQTRIIREGAPTP